MNGSKKMNRVRSRPQRSIWLIVFILAVATASGADRITESEPNDLFNRATLPAPQRQTVPMPLRFGPPRPSVTSPATFTPDMPFGQAIDILRNAIQPPLNLVVLWRELEENAGVDRNTPIGIDGLQGLRLRQYLKILLTSISASAVTRVGYTVQNGVITVATVDSLPRPKYVTRVYDISDLVAAPSYGGMGFGMMLGFGGGMPYGGGGYSPGYGSRYGNYGQTSGYSPLGGLPGFNGRYRGAGVYNR